MPFVAPFSRMVAICGADAPAERPLCPIQSVVLDEVMLMSAPSGEDALRALLAECVPGVLMHAPILDRATVVLDPIEGLIGVEQRDSANGVIHRFVWAPREDFTLTDMLTATARIAHAPLN